MPTEELDSDDAPIRRVDVELLVWHPTLNPAEISATLGLEADFALGVGELRKTPKGTRLGGVYRETRWRHCIRHDLREQWFADKVTAFVDRLLPHKSFFEETIRAGGRADLILQFFSDGYVGDNIPPSTLAKIADLQLDLGIEVYVV